MKVAEALNVKERSISFREAEILLQETLGQSRSWLHAHPEYVLLPAEEKKFKEYLDKREENIPVAYIIGHREFYGREFKIDNRALIPRPESEGIIDQVKELLPARFTKHTKETNKPCPLRILELGTGCGNLAVTAALELSVPTELLATDLSPEALELAKENWHTLKGNTKNTLRFIEADLFENPTLSQKAPYDAIIANLPYVPDLWKFDANAQAEVVFHEPDIALFGGVDGLDIYRRFFAEVKNYLMHDGIILIEYGEDETEALLPIAQATFPEASITVLKDYAGLDRILRIIL